MKTRLKLCVVSAVGAMVLSLPVFLWFSIWNGIKQSVETVAVRLWSCSCLTLLSCLEWGAESNGNDFWPFYTGSLERQSLQVELYLFASTSVLLWLIFGSMSCLSWAYRDHIIASLQSIIYLRGPKNLLAHQSEVAGTLYVTLWAGWTKRGVLLLVCTALYKLTVLHAINDL